MSIMNHNKLLNQYVRIDFRLIFNISVYIMTHIFMAIKPSLTFRWPLVTVSIGSNILQAPIQANRNKP